jgi:hypothetical protein
MESIHHVDDVTIAALQTLLPEVAFQQISSPIPRSSESAVFISLPASSGADYSFKLWLLPEKQIQAVLLADDSSEISFWYRPFEDADFNNSVDLRNKAFLETVELLISHETRIVQKVGLLFDSFRCEYKTAGGWHTVDSMGYFRMGNFNTPRIKGRRHIYYSAALALGMQK